MIYTLRTPNNLYSGVTEGVPFSQGIGKTEDKNIRNILVNDYKYDDITDYDGEQKEDETTEATVEGVDVSELTVDQLKEVAKELGLTNYSKLNRGELIELIDSASKDKEQLDA